VRSGDGNGDAAIRVIYSFPRVLQTDALPSRRTDFPDHPAVSTRLHHALLRAALLIAIPVAAPAQAAMPTPAAILAAGTFAYDRNAPLDLRDSLVGTQDGVRIHRVSFASPRGGRATGLLYVPSGKGPFAGVVLAHGMPGDAESFRGRGVYIARHGAVVITIDAPFDRRPGDPIDFTSRDSTEQVQLIVDLQRAVDVLLSRKDVDPARLAYVGRSYGGATGALFAGVERRLKTYVLASADGGITTRFVGPGAIAPPPGQEAQLQRWLAAMQPIEGLRFVGLANGSILFQNGRQDPIVTPARAEALQNAFTGTKVVKWYDAGHPLNTAAYVDQLTWLHEQVGTTAPGAADESGPEMPPPPTLPRRG